MIHPSSLHLIIISQNHKIWRIRARKKNNLVDMLAILKLINKISKKMQFKRVRS
jgi:hypothetical protein